MRKNLLFSLLITGLLSACSDVKETKKLSITSEITMNSIKRSALYIETNKICDENIACSNRLLNFIKENGRDPVSDSEVCHVYSQISSQYCDD